MSLSRVAAVLRARWLLIVCLTLAMAAAGVAATWVYNERIESTWVARAPVTFIRAESDTDTSVASRLESARQTAEASLTSPGIRVESNASQDQILFAAGAADRSTAIRLAEEARAAYLAVDPSSTLAGQMQANLSRLETEADAIEAQLGDAPAPTTDPATETLRTLLAQQLTNEIQQAASLRFQLSFPQFATAPPEELEPQLAEAEALIDELRAELDKLGNTSPTATTAPDDLDTLVLQRRLELIQNQYVELSLRLLDLQDSEGFTETVRATDETPQPFSPILGGVAGGVLGLILAAIGSMLHDRLRGPLLSEGDIRATAPLAVVHRSRPSPPGGGIWYAGAPPSSPRRRDVQALRAGLEPAFRRGHSSVALIGVSTTDRRVQELAADLAASVAATDRRVLLVDANVGAPSTLPEFSSAAPDLRDLITLERPHPEDVQAWMKETLAQRREQGRGLISFRTAAPIEDGADRLASPQFRWMLDAARDQTDAVIIAGPAQEDPGSDVLVQRVDHVVLVASRRKTTAGEIEALTAELDALGVGVAGAVLLVGGIGRRRRARKASTPRHRRRSNRVKRPSATDQVDPEEPVDLDAPNGNGHRSASRHIQSPLRLAAKTAFSAVDLVSERMPGPRLLIYHQIGTELGREMEVPLDTFVHQLDWMASDGMIVPLEAGLARVRDPDSDRLFVLTFDDGYQDLYTAAFPILRERRLPFTLYLATHPVESSEPLTPGGQADPLRWGQVTEMLDSGLMTLGAHTHRHVDLRGLDPETIAAELDTSNAIIERRTGVIPRHFAYPWGYWSEEGEPLVRERYVTAVLGGGEAITPKSDPHRLHRIPVQRSDGMLFFRRKMTGGMRLEEQVRRRVRGYTGAPS